MPVNIVPCAPFFRVSNAKDANHAAIPFVSYVCWIPNRWPTSNFLAQTAKSPLCGNRLTVCFRFRRCYFKFAIYRLTKRLIDTEYRSWAKKKCEQLKSDEEEELERQTKADELDLGVGDRPKMASSQKDPAADSTMEY